MILFVHFLLMLIYSHAASIVTVARTSFFFPPSILMTHISPSSIFLTIISAAVIMLPLIRIPEFNDAQSDSQFSGMVADSEGYYNCTFRYSGPGYGCHGGFGGLTSFYAASLPYFFLEG